MPDAKVEYPKSGHAKMRPRARLISLIGDEMVSDERVAVVELVKNAYDADASNVEVTFTGEGAYPDDLIISDDGCGMDLGAVLGGWFEPGTVVKKQAERSPRGRLYQGAKGVGRFAAARLANSLNMETRARGEKEGVAVVLNWGHFDDNSYLDEVEIAYEVRPLPHLKQGTLLRLAGLRDKKEWIETDFVALHERLSRLISPFGEVEDFKIHLTIPGHPDLTGEVEPHALTQSPKYTLEGKLSVDGHFTGRISMEDKEVRKFDNHSLGKKGETVTCGSFDVEVRAWDRDRQGLAPFMIKFDLGLRETRQVIDAYSGVSIYRDGFRVHPYGEPGNDWLQLDSRSRQVPTTRLANNQIIAAIRISREDNPELKDRTTREGLVHNPAYDSLRDWVVRVLALLEDERYKVRPREETKPEETHTLFEVFDLSPVVKEADRQLGREHPVSKLVRQSDEDIREGVVRLQEYYSRLLMTAGLGQLVDLVIHEIGSPVGKANLELAFLEKRLNSVLAEPSKSEASESINKLKSYLAHLVALRTRLDPKAAGQRGKSTTFDVADEIEANLQLFENLLGKQRIKAMVHKPKQPVAVKMMRSALGQVIANLLDNSVYWLTRHHGDGKGGQIDIHLNSTDAGFQLRYCDDGPGVTAETQDRIFDPYYSTKPNGMGLGLFIARQIMERYGKIIYHGGCKLGGAGFDVIFEKNVGQ
jgi:signal transduction histidine kinase